MFWISGFFGLAGVIAFFCTISDRNWIKSILILVLSVVMLLLSEFQYSLVENALYNEQIETRTYELVSLQDNSQVEGRFSARPVYVYGSINTEEVYSFYYKTSDGGFQRGKIDANKTIVYEQDNCKPIVVEYTVIEKCSLDEKLQKVILFRTHEKNVGSRYKVYVPTGTVGTDYNLDAK